ncbi:hypothetical protein [Rhizobium tumorigenes]|uniref:Uncharacterized protein n=1 Tax=Rhizobium tumorigenes TaxID=2041385 RepID=A0AAF1KCA1_9HYPH|nr:hypothetical protein [Rhizobium tumorigenes]WFR96872.1 hypothetical protein PR017_07095 [Rhizobium tumorigenes]
MSDDNWEEKNKRRIALHAAIAQERKSERLAGRTFVLPEHRRDQAAPASGTAPAVKEPATSGARNDADRKAYISDLWKRSIKAAASGRPLNFEAD